MSKKQSLEEIRAGIFAVTLVLIGLALISAIALDFVSSLIGEKSYVFLSRVQKEDVVPEKKPLTKILEEILASAGIPGGAIRQTEDTVGRPLFEVRVSLDTYREIEPSVDQNIRSEGIDFLERVEGVQAGREEFLWRLTAESGEEAGVLFICPVEPVAIAEVPPKKALIKKPSRGQVALIIDDMGNNLDTLKDILGLDRPVTVAILPYSPFARETAEIAHANDLEILLHLPLESMNNSNHTAYETDGMILAGMSDEEIRLAVEDHLDLVPFVRGVNNHMGSKSTTETRLMRSILARLKEKGLFFVDSRTTAQSIAFEEARRMGLPSTERDVFLDADEDRTMIRSRLLQLFQTAQRRGKAVGIGHPFPETMAVLKENFHLLEDYNLEAVFISKILEK